LDYIQIPEPEFSDELENLPGCEESSVLKINLHSNDMPLDMKQSKQRLQNLLNCIHDYKEKSVHPARQTRSDAPAALPI
jgi:hypothetical protein